MAEKSVEFETFPALYSDYENMVENKDYDDTVTVFTVPYEWFINWLDNEPESDFMSNYTWDDTLSMYNSAMAENVVLSERIERR